MNPGEHYARAEELLERADQCAVASIARQMVVTAQVHATLAGCSALFPTNAFQFVPIPQTVTATTDERL